jgi:hypothetical protein
LLLQVRCALLNGELLERFQRWFPAIGTRQIGLPWDWVPQRPNGSSKRLATQIVTFMWGLTAKVVHDKAGVINSDALQPLGCAEDCQGARPAVSRIRKTSTRAAARS